MNLYEFMDIYGYLWIFMDIYGLSGLCMQFSLLPPERKGCGFCKSDQISTYIGIGVPSKAMARAS
jgi:hypothetical protein